MVEVTQADEQAAKASWNAFADAFNQWDNLSHSEQQTVVDDFARHRTEATAALTAERDALAAIVEKYARHDGLCGIIGGYGYCTCGLDDARAKLEADNA